MQTDSALKDLRSLSGLMDSRFRGPFGWRFGWDGLLGMVPIVGDMVTNSISVYVIFRAAQLGCPPSVLGRMGLNLLIENVIDVIPFVGNLFDFVWKANSKNILLVERYLANPRSVRARSRGVLAITLALIFTAVVGSLVLAVYALSALIRYIEV